MIMLEENWKLDGGTWNPSLNLQWELEEEDT